MFFTNKRDKRFFDLFIEEATNLANGVKAFEDLLDNFDQLEERAGKLKRLEDEGDRITHEIINELNRTFVTPLDREDILVLAGKLDDIIDYIEAASARMVSYRVAEPGPHLTSSPGFSPSVPMRSFRLSSFSEKRSSTKSAVIALSSTGWRTTGTICSARQCGTSSPTRNGIR